MHVHSLPVHNFWQEVCTRILHVTHTMQKERDSLTQQLKSTQQQLSALQEQYDKHVMEVQVRIAFH